MNDFEKYYRENRKKHVNSINRYVNNYATSEDIVQDAFVRAFTQLGKYDPKKGSFGSWFSRLLYNAVSNHFKKPQWLYAEEQKEQEEYVDYNDIINNIYSFYQILDGVNKNLNYKVLSMFYVNGYNQTEVAEVLGITKDRVAKICQRFKDR